MTLPPDGPASQGRESCQVDSSKPGSSLTTPVRTNVRLAYGASRTHHPILFDRTIRRWTVQTHPCTPTLRTVGTGYGRIRPLALSPSGFYVANMQEGGAHAPPGSHHPGTDLYHPGAPKEAAAKVGPIFTQRNEYRRSQVQGPHPSCKSAPLVRGLDCS
jgi:hypothetical protein